MLSYHQHRLCCVYLDRCHYAISFTGEVTDYADMLTEARQIATGRMVKDAEALGADAIVGMRYASASVMQGAAEVIAYGTAVKFV